MTRFKLVIEYDGTPFQGWQRQKHGPSVQACLERAAADVLGEAVDVFGAGRTDSGVHARGQVAHLDSEKDIRPDRLRDGMNHHLGAAPVAVLNAVEVDPTFHARFDAVERRYLYRMVGRRPPLALDAMRSWRIPQALDPDAMHAAAQALVGHHDFSTFRDTQCQARSPEKTLDELVVSRVGEEVHVRARARSFLHRQVRSIVGSLAEVGRGKWAAERVAEALAARDRKACGPVAPAHGLYLMGVDY